MELLKQLLSPGEIIVQIICFLILFTLLKKFVWNIFLKLLDERKERIASEFKKIGDLQSNAAKLKADYEQQLNTIDETAQKKIQEAVHQGKEIAGQIQDNARKDADKIIAAAKDNIQLEISKAKEELKKTMVDMTIRATEKLIKEKHNKEQDRKLVNDFLAELEDTHGR